jgi:hypothetical protein
MSRDQEIAMLEKKLKKLKAKGEVRKKVGLKEGFKRSFKMFGESASTVFGSLKEAGNTVLSPQQAQQPPKLKGSQPSGTVDLDDVLRRLPA